jgi:potassium efflux system protein
MMRSVIFIFLLLAALAALGAPDGNAARDLNTTPPLTLEAVEARIKRLESEPQLLNNADLTTQVLAEYQEAVEALRDAAEWSRRADESEAAAQNAPKALAEARALLTTGPIEPASDLPATPTLQQLEQALRASQVALETAQKQADELAAEPLRRAGRRAQIPALLAEVQERKGALDARLRKAAETPQSALAIARATAATALQKTVEQQIRALNAEQSAYDAEVDLLTVRRDLALREVETLRARVDALQTMLRDLRRREAAEKARAARAASEQLIGAHPSVRAIARENERLAAARTGSKGITERIAQAQAQLKAARENLDRVRQDHAAARERVRAAGLNQVVGLVLRAQRDKLPDVVRLTRDIQERQRSLPEAHLLLIELQDSRARLGNLDSAVKQALAAAQSDHATTSVDQLTSVVRELLITQREYLDSLIADKTFYFALLADLDAAERALVAETESFARFIDEQVLWIRSSPSLGAEQFARIGQLLATLATSGDLPRMLAATGRDLVKRPGDVVIVVLVSLLFFAIPARASRRLAKSGETVRLSVSAPARVTLTALGATLLLAARWPAMLGVIGWIISRTENAAELWTASGVALVRIAYVLLGFQVVRHACTPGGLAAAHFGWSAEALGHLRKAIPPTLAVYLPAVFLYQGSRTHGADIVRREQLDALGQLSLVIALLALSGFLAHLLHPRRGILAAPLRANPGGWLARLKFFWYAGLAGVPAAMALGAWAGYDYTAAMLALRFQITLCLIVALVLLHGLAERGMLVARLHFAQRRSREHAELAATGEGAQAADSETLYAELARADAQSRRLLRLVFAGVFVVAAWFVWVDILPALGYLNQPQFRLWSYTTKVTEVTRDASGAEKRQVVERVVPVTVGSVLLAVMVVVITVIAARNLPGLLEVAVLSRLPMQAGGRYAATQVARYIIVILGIFVSAALLGVGWSDVQWLAAAATVGLAFGMQEIVGNFVSGLILLFERPVRIGDIVTINNVTGRVTRIRMRATTILDWDNREHIVPNKTLITGQIVNWTLSDSVARLEFRVGVAYGSNPDEVRELLLRAARETPGVLEEPPPHALLDGFGDSALQFVMRCYIPKLDISLSTRHEVQRRISELFAQNHIVIPFPQREVRVVKPGGTASEQEPEGES